MLDDSLLESPEDDDVALRVMVVDDHDLFRTGLRRLLDDQDGLEVVADARRGEEAVARARELHPDVIVMDISMPGMSGIETTRELAVVSPRSVVLVLTVNADEETVIEALIAGAAGYLLKDSTLPVIVEGIRAAANRDSVVSPAVARSLVTRLRRYGSRDVMPGVDPQLSPRELEVLRLIVTGCENTEIGEHMHLSASTIKRHVSNTLEKLGVGNRIQAAVLAVRLGLVDENDAPSTRNGSGASV